MNEAEVRRIQEHSKQRFSEEWAAESVTFKMRTWDALAAEWLAQREALREIERSLQVNWYATAPRARDIARAVLAAEGEPE